MRIGKMGARITLPDATWWADWMALQRGALLEMRIDSRDVRTAQFFELSGIPVGSAEIKTIGGNPTQASTWKEGVRV